MGNKKTSEEYDIASKTFSNTSFGNVKVDRIIDLINSFLEEVPDAVYSLAIGSDSHEKNGSSDHKNHINIVTAITVHRKGSGGIYFWTRKDSGEIHSLREKIYSETIESLRFAENFVPILQKKLNGHSPNLEIHVDVGEHGATRDMIKEVVGMVNGYGYIAKTKPMAYGASNVADRHT